MGYVNVVTKSIGQVRKGSGGSKGTRLGDLGIAVVSIRLKFHSKGNAIKYGGGGEQTGNADRIAPKK